MEQRSRCNQNRNCSSCTVTDGARNRRGVFRVGTDPFIARHRSRDAGSTSAESNLFRAGTFALCGVRRGIIGDPARKKSNIRAGNDGDKSPTLSPGGIEQIDFVFAARNHAQVDLAIFPQSSRPPPQRAHRSRSAMPRSAAAGNLSLPKIVWGEARVAKSGRRLGDRDRENRPGTSPRLVQRTSRSPR